MSTNPKWHLDTVAVKTYADRPKQARPLSLPIECGTTYEIGTAEEHKRLLQEATPKFYQRFGHPTLEAAAEKIAALERAESAAVFSSGMAAISTVFLALLSHGDHVACQSPGFDQTARLLGWMNRAYGVEATFVDFSEHPDAIDRLPINTKLVHLETPSNPMLSIQDIARICQACRKRDIVVSVDSTFGTPSLQRPIALGASVVVHSATKFLSGHMDVMAGAVAGSRDLISRIRAIQVLLGGVLDPHAAWLLLRGIKTLSVRMHKIGENAMAIAEFLQNHPAVASVEYPYLESSKFSEIARRQMSGGGGVISFALKTGLEGAHRLLNRLQLISVATSLGGTETVIEVPGDLDWSAGWFVRSPAESRIPHGLMRLSVGLENSGDLQNDLAQALALE